jgi:hypothetical protein
MIGCKKCTGRVFIDRVFTDNRNFELYCIMCGDRKFITKRSELGKWLAKQEAARMNAAIIAR